MTSPSPTLAQVQDALRTVMDPEISINLMDLGVIYDIHLKDGAALIAMTTTSPHCPMHEILLAGARSAVMRVPGIQTCEVRLVFDPPWNPTMMSEAAKKALRGGL